MTIISPEVIQEVKERLIKAYNPVSMYIFGPYGWGTPNEDDDLNLLVVIEASNEKAHKRGYKAFEALFSLEIPKNVVILTQAEVDKHLKDATSMCYEVINRGKLLYARN